jgi:hypothetical protein
LFAEAPLNSTANIEAGALTSSLPPAAIGTTPESAMAMAMAMAVMHARRLVMTRCMMVATHDFVDVPQSQVDVEGVDHTLCTRERMANRTLTLMSALTCLVSCILQHTRMCESNLCL